MRAFTVHCEEDIIRCFFFLNSLQKQHFSFLFFHRLEILVRFRFWARFFSLLIFFFFCLFCYFSFENSFVCYYYFMLINLFTFWLPFYRQEFLFCFHNSVFFFRVCVCVRGRNAAIPGGRTQRIFSILVF